jgi:UDP-N-acetylglucosamine:LPS N-acetylglucosamine transferase
MISDVEFTADFVRNQILPVVTNAEKLAEMSKASARLGHKDSATELANLVLTIAGKAKE